MKISLSQVRMQYTGQVEGLKNINLVVDEKRVGILGQSGSGKSSLLNILATILKPTSGSVTCNGKNIYSSPQEFRSMLGFLPQDFGLYGTLTTIEYLSYISALKGIYQPTIKKQIKKALDMVNFTTSGKALLSSLSSVERQRVAIAQMFLTDSKIIIIDELSEDLSEEERTEILQMVNECTKDRILFYASEYADDFAGLVDEFIFLSEGKILLKTTPDEALSLVQDKVWELTIANLTLSTIRRKFMTTKTEQTKEGMRVRCLSDSEPIPSARKVQPSLNDAYQYFLHTRQTRLQ